MLGGDKWSVNREKIKLPFKKYGRAHLTDVNVRLFKTGAAISASLNSHTFVGYYSI